MNSDSIRAILFLKRLTNVQRQELVRLLAKFLFDIERQQRESNTMREL